MRIILSALLILIVAVIAYLFGDNNQQLVTVNYFIAKGDFKLSWVIGFALVCGFLLSWLISAYFYYSLKMRFALTKRKLNKLEKQQEMAIEAN